jgi:hypothetical protein
VIFSGTRFLISLKILSTISCPVSDGKSSHASNLATLSRIWRHF